MKVTFKATNAGKGYKIRVNDQWLVTKKESLLNVIAGLSDYCVFRVAQSETDEDTEDLSKE